MDVRARPIEKDAILGPILQYEFAKVLALLGHRNQAIDILANLFLVPSSLTSNLIKLDPIWDGLRSEVKYEELIRFQDEVRRNITM